MTTKHTEADLVSFGNFLLKQDKRKRSVRNRNSVTDRDLDYWRVSEGIPTPDKSEAS